MGGQLGKQPQCPPLGVEGLDCQPQVLYWKPSTCARGGLSAQILCGKQNWYLGSFLQRPGQRGSVGGCG